VSQIILSPCLLLLDLMPQASNSRSPAQKNQTRSLHVLWVTQRQGPASTEGKRAQILQLKDKVKNIQQELRNERKRTKRAKAARLRDVQLGKDKENVCMRAPADQEEEVKRLKERLVEVEKQLEGRRRSAPQEEGLSFS